MATTYNYDRYRMSEYDLDSFPDRGPSEQAEDFALTALDGDMHLGYGALPNLA
ncbi:MAG: hypothetical protein OEN55_15405 [Alphaproteobacteria bacterium]|nr:hypothetical protein [Alphaproteobacteria bacterium]